MARRKRALNKQGIERKREEILARLLSLLDDKESEQSAEIKTVWARLLRLLDDDEMGAFLAALEAELDGGSPVSLRTSMLSAEAVRKMMSASTTRERRILGFNTLGRQKEMKADRHARDIVLGRVQAKGASDRVTRLLAGHLTSRQVVRVYACLTKLRDLARRAGRVFGLGGVGPR
jgi:hypothetical protein